MFESMAVGRTLRVRVGLRQGCVSSPLLFVIFMDRISRRSTTPDCVTTENAKVESLLLAEDVARLTSSSAGLQRVLDRFATECRMTGMQISTRKTEVMVLSRKKEQCAVSVNGTPLKQVERFKYLEVEFSNDARQDCEIDRRIGSASAILRSLYQSVVAKKEISRRTKMVIFNAVYRPALIYGHEQ